MKTRFWTATIVASAMLVWPVHTGRTDGLSAPIFRTLDGYAPGKRPREKSEDIGRNLLRNPGLEDTDKSGTPSAWRVVGKTSAIVDTPHSGQRALRVRNPGWPKIDGRLVQDVLSVPGGTTYRAAIFARSVSGDLNMNIKLEVFGTGNKYLGGFRSEHFTVPGNGNWVQLEYTHKLPPDPKLRVTVLYRLWGKGPVLLDDASFGPVRHEPLYLSPRAKGERLARTPELLVWTAPLPTRIRARHSVDVTKARKWPKGQLHLRLAGNETGILPLFLSATGPDLADISIRIEAADPAANAVFDMKLFAVEPFQYLGDLYWDVLVPTQTFRLPPGNSKMLWLSVYMPPGEKRRTLRGAFQLGVKGRQPMSIPFIAEPFGFDLPRTPSLPFSVGVPRPGRRIRASERRQWLHDIARHRLSIRHLASPGLRFNGDEAICDFTAFDAELTDARALGMGLFQLPFAYVAWGHGSRYTQRFGPLGSDNISDEFRRKFPNAMRVLARHLAEKGVLQRFNHNLFDEPYPKHYPQLRELAGLLKKADPRYRPSVYGGGSAAANGPLAGAIEEAVGAGWDPVAREIIRKRGEIVSIYNPLQTFDITRRPERVRGFPWWVFRCRIDRVYQWCICPAARSMRSHDYGSAWVFLDPPRDAFLSTVRFEMLREGLEDYEYLTLFARAVDRTGARLGVTKVDGHAVADSFAAMVTDRRIMHQSTDPRSYRRVRRFLGDAIESLEHPPLFLFRPAEKPEDDGRQRITFWLDKGVQAEVRGGDVHTLTQSGTTVVTPDAAGNVELSVTGNGRTKRLCVPVR